MISKSQIQQQGSAVIEICTITHEGSDFTNLGSIIDTEQGFVVGYVRDNRLTSWDGSREIATLEKVSTWRVHSWMSGTMSAYRATIRGKRYHGRGFGEGMVLRLRCNSV